MTRSPKLHFATNVVFPFCRIFLILSFTITGLGAKHEYLSMFALMRASCSATVGIVQKVVIVQNMQIEVALRVGDDFLFSIVDLPALRVSSPSRHAALRGGMPATSTQNITK